MEPGAIEFADELAMMADFEDACGVAVAEFGKFAFVHAREFAEAVEV